jgi:RNA polymerase sigma-70 factor (ECF subfamily)
MPLMDDAALVEALAVRCTDAFDEIHRRHASTVVSMGRRVAYDVGTADEVAQEVLLGLWERPERFDPERGSLPAYLSTVARGRALDRVRADSARRARELRQGREEAVGEGLDGAVIRTLDAQRVRSALAILPANERVPLELAFFEGHTYTAVAVVLDLPEGTVKSRIRTGLRRLRAMLAAEGATLKPTTPPVGAGLSVEYRIDAHDRVVPVGAGWGRFAEDNGAPELVAPSRERTLWGYLEGDDIAALWELLVLRVRLTQTRVQLPYRCDAPTFRRWFDMTLTPEPDDVVHFRSVLVREETRAEVAYSVARPLHSADAALVVCSWCSRCDDGVRWTLFEDHVRERSLTEEHAAPAITHGICPVCADMLRAEIIEG